MKILPSGRLLEGTFPKGQFVANLREVNQALDAITPGGVHVVHVFIPLSGPHTPVGFLKNLTPNQIFSANDIKVYSIDVIDFIPPLSTLFRS